jgi:hypothetical protein
MIVPRTALAVLLALCIAPLAGTQASAQSGASQAQAQPPQPPRPPVIIVDPSSIYRGPPAPPERPQYAPPSMSPPMERISPLPPMSPRIGN